jgi:HNH endonuclease
MEPMAIIIKCDPGDVGADDMFTSEAVWIYENSELILGDEAFVWWTKEIPGADGLAMHGDLVGIEHEPVQRGKGASLTVKIDAKSPGRKLKTEDLEEYDVRNSDVPKLPHHPLHGLCRKLLANSHRKVASLDSDEAAYLRGVFGHARSGDGVTFDPNGVEDGRKNILAEVSRRQGQDSFRAALLEAYDGRCAISGTRAIDVLQAAHITAYLGPQTNHATNGLLLRADLHNLFDLKLIRIDPQSFIISVSVVLKRTEYWEFSGKTIDLPSKPNSRPSPLALAKHFNGAA